MGLVGDGSGRTAVLSDIAGEEDHYGDMDFKVAGSKKGITREIMEEALSQAREGRIHILVNMLRTLERPREDILQYAPLIISIMVNQEKIRDIIGPGGKVILIDPMGRVKLSRRELLVDEGGPEGGGDRRPDDDGGERRPRQKAPRSWWPVRLGQLIGSTEPE